MHPFLEENKKKLTIAYIIVLVFGFFYVKSALDDNSIKLSEKKEEERGVEVKPVKVALNVNTPNSTTYQKRMQNVDTVYDLLRKVKDEDNFWYEKTAYIYGVEISEVQKIKAPEGFRWAVLKENEDITYKIRETKLEDDATYEIRLVDDLKLKDL